MVAGCQQHPWLLTEQHWAGIIVFFQLPFSNKILHLIYMLMMQACGSLPTLSLRLSGWRWAPGLDAAAPAPPLCPGPALTLCCFSCSRSQTRQVRPAEREHKAEGRTSEKNKSIKWNQAMWAYSHYLLLETYSNAHLLCLNCNHRYAFIFVNHYLIISAWR